METIVNTIGCVDNHMHRKMDLDTADQITAIAGELIGVAEILLLMLEYEGGKHFLTLAKVCERHGLELMKNAEL